MLTHPQENSDSIRGECAGTELRVGLEKAFDFQLQNLPCCFLSAGKKFPLFIAPQDPRR